MPVSVLVVEGKLDMVLLDAVLMGRPAVQRCGAKYELKARVREEQRIKGLSICYLRDRDFDADPPKDRTCPWVHAQTKAGDVLGWCWCRHEIESYLLEPTLVAHAIGCEETKYSEALRAAALRIRDYQAARAAIGRTRRALPPNYELETRPDDLPDDALRLPPDLSWQAVSRWAAAETERFRVRVCPQLEPSAFARALTELREIYSDEVLSHPDEILAWFSGKDLMAAIEPWLGERGFANAGDFRARTRDWIRAHPEETLQILPEWRNLVAILNA